MDKIEEVLKFVEPLIRGKPPALPRDQLICMCTELMIWARELQNDSDISLQESYSNVGVKLYNKVRNISSPNFREVKSTLKATAAFILLRFAKISTSSIAIILKLLCRSAQELRSVVGFAEHSISCCIAAGKAWSQFATIAQGLPPVELQDVKIAVFYAFMQIGQSVDDSETSRLAISQGLELVQTLPNNMKLFFAETTLSVASNRVEAKNYTEAVNYFQIGIHGLEIVQSGGSKKSLNPAINDVSTEPDVQQNGPIDIAAVWRTKIRAHLSLAYTYNEMNQCDKALICIQSVESLITNCSDMAITQEFSQTVLTAKFMIYAKDQDNGMMEKALWQLIHDCSAASVILECADKYFGVKPQVDRGAVNKMFSSICAKFARCQEFAQCRLAQAKLLLLASFQSCNSNETEGESAFVICRELVHMHRHSTTALPSSVYDDLKSLLFQQMKLCRSKEDWSGLCCWEEVLSELLSQTNDDDLSVQVHLHKADAMLHLKNFEAASDVAARSLGLRITSGAIVLGFCSCLHSKGSQAALQLVRSLIEKALSALNPAEILNCLEKCRSYLRGCDHLTTDESRDAMIEIMSLWLETFQSLAVWRMCNYDDSKSLSFFMVFADMMQLLVLKFIKNDGVMRDEGKSAGSESTVALVDSQVLFEEAVVPCLSCTPSVIREELLAKSNSLVNLLNQIADEGSVASLGDFKDLEWIANCTWNVGTVLLKCRRKSLDSSVNFTDFHICAAECLELCENLFHRIPYVDPVLTAKNRCLCLVLASAARLDAHSLDRNKKSDALGTLSFSGKSNELKQDTIASFQRVQWNCEAVMKHLGPGAGIAGLSPDQSEFLKHLERLGFMLLFSLACKSSVDKLKSFYDAHYDSFFRLTPSEIRTCSGMAEKELGGSAEIVRSLLVIALQTATRDPFPDYCFIGSVYCKLIELSPSRAHAIQRVEEFYQLLTNCSKQRADIQHGEEIKPEANFDLDDIDRVASLSFNYGVTLSELGQVELAERFMSLSISLIQFCSPALLEWKPRIQESYEAVLRLKLTGESSTDKMLNNACRPLRDDRRTISPPARNEKDSAIQSSDML